MMRSVPFRGKNRKVGPFHGADPSGMATHADAFPKSPMPFLPLQIRLPGASVKAGDCLFCLDDLPDRPISNRLLISGF